MGDGTTPWLDSYPPGVPQHVEVPATNLARVLDDAARDFPNAPALHFEGRTISYAQLADRAWRFAGVLAGLGVTKGTRVGLVLPNCPQAVIAFFGALRLGAVVVQNNPLYTERELGHQLTDAGVGGVAGVGGTQVGDHRPGEPDGLRLGPRGGGGGQPEHPPDHVPVRLRH